jgi:hypothetical protein
VVTFVVVIFYNFVFGAFLGVSRFLGKGSKKKTGNKFEYVSKTFTGEIFFRGGFFSRVDFLLRW